LSTCSFSRNARNTQSFPWLTFAVKNTNPITTPKPMVVSTAHLKI
jgi:hypothetical protein